MRYQRKTSLFKNFEQRTQNTSKRKRKINKIWYNPPFSNLVKTSIGRKFKLENKIFNKHTMRISYSYTAKFSAQPKSSQSKKTE